MAEIAASIVKIALKIAEAVETVQENKEECDMIARCVQRNSGIVQRLVQQTDITKDEVMLGALEDVKTYCEESLELVKKCQNMHTISQFISAKDIAKDLDRTLRNIGLMMQVATSCSSTEAAIIGSKILSALTTALAAGGGGGGGEEDATFQSIRVATVPPPQQPPLPGKEAGTHFSRPTAPLPPHTPPRPEAPTPSLGPLADEGEARIVHPAVTTAALPLRLPPIEEVTVHTQPPPPSREDDIDDTSGSLMPETAFSSLGIADIVLEITKAVETVHQNQKHCRKIAREAENSSRKLQPLLKQMHIPRVREALEDMEATLEDALKIVKKCQNRRNIFGCFSSIAIAKDLKQVVRDIGLKMENVYFCATANASSVPPAEGTIAPPPPPTEEDDIEVSQAGFARFSLSVLKKATNNFSEENKIGQGGFSLVYKGVLYDGREVAIKKFYRDPNSEDLSLGICEEMCVAELTFGRKLQHKNLVSTLGYCINIRGVLVEHQGKLVLAQCQEYILVLGYVPNGSLDDIIRGSRHIDWSSCFKIIQEIADGVHYIHQQRVIHSDLKPSNILFNSDMTPVIIDFGLSKVLEHDEDDKIVTEDLRGTMGYLAPELFSAGEISFKSDVFTFGVTLCKTITGKRKWIFMEEEEMLEQAGGLKGLLNPAMQVDESQLPEIKRCLKVWRLCTQLDPADRPSMADVVDMLSGKKTLPAPKKLERLVTKRMENSATKNLGRAD